MSFKQYDNLIIDGNNFLFRAFYAKRAPKYVNGLNVTPIHQFLSMLKSSTDNFKPSQVILTWDRKKNSTKRNFRKDLVPYKENRPENDKMEELHQIINHVQRFVDVLGIHTYYPVNMEADDIIRFLTLSEDKSTLIISSDRDLIQLVNDNVSLYLPNKGEIVDSENFETFAQVPTPEMFVVYKSIMGDVSDNIEGLTKYGPVRGKALTEKIMKHGIIDWSVPDLTDDQKDVLRKNLKVIDLKNTEVLCPDEYDFYQQQKEYMNVEYDGDNLRHLFQEYQLNSFLNNFNEWSHLFNKNKDDSDLLSRIRL
jgi:5'-3' exonuclease